MTRRIAAKDREIPSGHTSSAKYICTHAGEVRIRSIGPLFRQTDAAGRCPYGTSIREDHKTLDLGEIKR